MRCMIFCFTPNIKWKKQLLRPKAMNPQRNRLPANDKLSLQRENDSAFSSLQRSVHSIVQLHRSVYAMQGCGLNTKLFLQTA